MLLLAESIPCLLMHWLLTSPGHQRADLEIMKFPDINMFLIGIFMFRLRRGWSQICSLISLFEMWRFMIIPHANANISMFQVNEAILVNVLFVTPGPLFGN